MVLLRAAHVPDLNTNYILDQQGYIEFNSSLADNQALQIYASDGAGGIVMSAGTGGIAIDTTNAISLDAGAESNFTTTSGNLVFTSAGLINMESNSGGFNIGSNSVAQTINIGTGSANKAINVGTNTGTSGINMNTGSDGFSLDTTAGGSISLDAIGASK